jgi:hypothetical protein
MSLWWFLLIIATNPQWLRLPGSGAISNFALLLAAYLPAGVLIGDLFGQLMARLGTRWWCGALATLLIAGVGVGGARARMADVSMPQHTLVTRPDLRAMTWIEENTPKEAQFLVNSFFAYGGRSLVASDGGCWLPLLARRANTVPPLNYKIEKEPYPGYREWVNALSAEIRDQGINHPEVLALLRERGITHVYIGQRQGRMNYDGPHVLDAHQLLDSPHFRLIYRQDRVCIFDVVKTP